MVGKLAVLSVTVLSQTTSIYFSQIIQITCASGMAVADQNIYCQRNSSSCRAATVAVVDVQPPSHRYNQLYRYDASLYFHSYVNFSTCHGGTDPVSYGAFRH